MCPVRLRPSLLTCISGGRIGVGPGPEPDDHGRGGHLDHAVQRRSIHGDERVAEVEGDRLELVTPGDIAHVEALDGQIARNGQYEQVIRSGLAV